MKHPRSGFDGIENGHRWPDEPKALKELLGGYGLKFVSGWYSLNLLTQTAEDEKKAIQPHLDKLKYNGCKVCIVCETSNSIQGPQRTSVQEPQADRRRDESLLCQGRRRRCLLC